MALIIEEPMNEDIPRGKDDGSVKIKNCEANTWVSSELKCPILNKIIKAENGICKERCEFVS